MYGLSWDGACVYTRRIIVGRIGPEGVKSLPDDKDWTVRMTAIMRAPIEVAGPVKRSGP